MNPSSLHQLGLLAVTGASALAGLGAVSALFGGAGCAVVTNDALDDAGVFEDSDAAVSTCQSCVADGCTPAWAMCLTDESCLAIRTCASGAGCDTACKTSCACRAARDGGLRAESVYRAFTACNDARTCTSAGCAVDCASSCSGAGPTTPGACNDLDAAAESDAGNAETGARDGGLDLDAGDAAAPGAPTADSCASCAQSKCGNAKKACAVGSECASFLECAFACAESTCVDDCGRRHATGKVAAVELAACTQAGCERECGLLNR